MKAASPMVRVAVLVSVGRHPVSSVPRYSRNDALALEAARLLVASTSGATLDVIHAGDAGNPALRDYLALGAERVEVLPVAPAAAPGPADVPGLAPGANILPALAQRLKGYDLVVCGTRSEGADDSGMLPYLLAASLDMALVADAVDFRREADELMVRQFLPQGRRRRVAIRLPALVVVHPLASAAPRYAYARLMAGTVSPAPGLKAPANAGFDAGRAAGTHPGIDADPGGAWRSERVTGRPRRLAATEKRSGHARMMAATVAESRGGQVVNEGSARDKAQAILAYLREHRLIDY